jgi:hypothetical protein
MLDSELTEEDKQFLFAPEFLRILLKNSQKRRNLKLCGEVFVWLSGVNETMSGIVSELLIETLSQEGEENAKVCLYVIMQVMAAKDQYAEKRVNFFFFAEKINIHNFLRELFFWGVIH